MTPSEKHYYPDPEWTAFETVTPAREPRLAAFPRFLPENVLQRLSNAHIDCLYAHQAQALTEIYNRNDLILSTGTSSGKSLCYQLPIIDQTVNTPNDCALLIYPTKALTQDQFISLRKFLPDFADKIAVFDGDTPSRYRAAIKNSARIILTNPDMLHHGLLPFHPGWERFFRNLKIVVIDEVHIYRGIFGSHVAHVFRRLNRVCAYYARTPQPHQHILASATLSNAVPLAEKLIDRPVVGITDDASGNGQRDIYFINPPVINEQFNLRAGAIHTGARIARDLTQRSFQTLLFLQSRQSVESAVRRLRSFDINADGYRSGYLSSERRKIESGLKSGELSCVAATNALELGMDIGTMDAVISIGYPGSIAALAQRMGRAGRNRRPAKFFFVATQNPTDQYILNHPEFVLERKIEPALIDPDNLLLVFQHLQCALFELPFRTDESYPGLSLESTQQLLAYFESQGIAKRSRDQYFWITSDKPQHTVSLRNAGLDRIAIQTETLQGNRVRIGEIDRPSSYHMTHEGAIYFHNGAAYRIDKLDLIENVALAIPTVPTYTTQAVSNITLLVNERLDETTLPNGMTCIADVTVTSQVTAYRKYDIETYELLGLMPLDLPSETLETKAFVFVISDAFRNTLRDNLTWSNDPNDYGPNWQELRRLVLARDGNTCQLCHHVDQPNFFHVHHIVPFRSFQRPEDANALENLSTLCPNCHRRVEESVRIRSGLSGFAYAFHQIAALFLECDVSDLNLFVESESSQFDGLPAFFLYETVPGGLGLSQAIRDRFPDILAAVTDLIGSCTCVEGCPGCVGAAGEDGIGGKPEALAIAKGFAAQPG